MAATIAVARAHFKSKGEAAMRETRQTEVPVQPSTTGKFFVNVRRTLSLQWEKQRGENEEVNSERSLTKSKIGIKEFVLTVVPPKDGRLNPARRRPELDRCNLTSAEGHLS
jgi:hypothetical protein